MVKSSEARPYQKKGENDFNVVFSWIFVGVINVHFDFVQYLYVKNF